MGCKGNAARKHMQITCMTKTPLIPEVHWELQSPTRKSHAWQRNPRSQNGTAKFSLAYHMQTTRKASTCVRKTPLLPEVHWELQSPTRKSHAWQRDPRSQNGTAKFSLAYQMQTTRKSHAITFQQFLCSKHSLKNLANVDVTSLGSCKAKKVETEGAGPQKRAS